MKGEEALAGEEGNGMQAVEGTACGKHYGRQNMARDPT
jgi:hypothetical protein